MFDEETYYWVYISGSDYPWISSDSMEAIAGEDVDEAINNGLQPWLGSDILKAQDSGELVGAILYDYESHEELGTVEQLQNQDQNLYSGKFVKSASPIGKVHDLYKINQVTAEGAIEALVGMGYKRPQAKSIVEGWGETVKSSANRTEASFDKTLLSELTAWLPTDEKNDLLAYVKKNYDIPEEFNWEETRESLGDEKFYKEITAAMTMDRFQEFQDDYDRLFSSKSLKDLVGTTVTCTKGYNHPNMGKLFDKGKTYTVSEKDGRVYVGGTFISDEFFNEHFVTSSKKVPLKSAYYLYDPFEGTDLHGLSESELIKELLEIFEDTPLGPDLQSVANGEKSLSDVQFPSNDEMGPDFEGFEWGIDERLDSSKSPIQSDMKRDIQKMIEYRQKGSNPEALARSVKDMDKAKNRLAIAKAMGWSEAEDAFFERLLELGASNEEIMTIPEVDLSEVSDSVNKASSVGATGKRSLPAPLDRYLRSLGLSYSMESMSPTRQAYYKDLGNGRRYTLMYKITASNGAVFYFVDHSNEGGGSYGYSLADDPNNSLLGEDLSIAKCLERLKRILPEDQAVASARKVTVEFSDDSQAEPFKQEMKKHFNYPENVSKHQVVFGKDENGKPVFVGNSKRISNSDISASSIKTMGDLIQFMRFNGMPEPARALEISYFNDESDSTPVSEFFENHPGYDTGYFFTTTDDFVYDAENKDDPEGEDYRRADDLIFNVVEGLDLGIDSSKRISSGMGYNLGFRAALEGKTTDDNPFKHGKPGSELRKISIDWDKGFDAGCQVPPGQEKQALRALDYEDEGESLERANGLREMYSANLREAHALGIITQAELRSQLIMSANIAPGFTPSYYEGRSNRYYFEFDGTAPDEEAIIKIENNPLLSVSRTTSNLSNPLLCHIEADGPEARTINPLELLKEAGFSGSYIEVNNVAETFLPIIQQAQEDADTTGTGTIGEFELRRLKNGTYRLVDPTRPTIRFITGISPEELFNEPVLSYIVGLSGLENRVSGTL